MPGYKKDFPLLKGNDLVYLDNAATAQRPMPVSYTHLTLPTILRV